MSEIILNPFMHSAYTIATLGETTAFGETSTNTRIHAAKRTPTGDGFIDSISVYVDAPSATDMLVGVYSDTAGEPDARLGLSVATSIQTTGAEWVTIPLITPAAITNGTPIWLAFDCENFTWHQLTEVAGGIYTRGTFGQLEMNDPFGLLNLDPPVTNKRVSVYANVRYAN